MGLIKAIKNAVGSELGDQWREYFYCDSLANNVLVRKGSKRTSDTRQSSNQKGETNIISNGSIIAVNEGQCMMIVDQGKVVEFCAEAGEFIYDASTEPSLFYGQFGDNIVKTFATIGKRFTFGGDPGKDQRVYFFNTKEILDNKYGTANPVPFRVVDTNIGLDMDISVRCNGSYSFKIIDPLLFYTNVCGNVAEEYTREQLETQLKSELMTALQPAFGKISAMGIRYSAIVSHTRELAEALNEELSQQWAGLRGITIVSFGVNSIKASEEDEATIKQYQKMAMLRDPNMAAASLVESQSEAMKAAAKNESTGPMMAFAGMNMANMAGGMNAGNLFAMGQQNQNAQQMQQPNMQQNAQQGGAAGWSCSCGTVNKGKFCTECGAKKPAGAPLYKCDKCGWEPKDPTNPPKFCPECGDVFDDSDIQK